MAMIEIDGGQGGGGVLRTAIGLALATGRPVRVDDVRGDRPEPGLKPQHVACVDAARQVSDGTVTGDGLGSETVEFIPGSIEGVPVDVDVGTAGSATLVCSTVLPAAAAAEGTVTLHVTGGTDVAWSPPADYFGGVTVAVLRAHGLAAALDVIRRGFYPVGGGTLGLTFGPSTLEPLSLDGRPSADRARIAAVASNDLLDADVADRLARTADERLAEHGLRVVSRGAEYVDSASTGAVVVVRIESAHGSTGPRPVAGFSALGEPGVPAEEVATAAVEDLREWTDGSGVVDRHLADQLVPYLALAGGAVRIPEVTDHVESAVSVAREFGFDVAIDRDTEVGGVLLRAAR